jgi:Tol biopolymer transport system component
MALLDARTGEVELLGFAPRGARPLTWSSGRESLLFLAPIGGKLHRVFAWHRESGEVRRIAGRAYQYLGASYGPDGRLALARLDPREGAQARSRIFVTRPGGGGARPITQGPADAWPVWSPDGSVLVYSSIDESGQGVILAIDPLEGGEPRRIARGMEPDFFPDGEWLVYCAKRRGRWALWRVRADGSGRRPIGSGTSDERDPTVSPDGRFIVYVSEDDDYQRLRVRPVDGSGDRPLLTDFDGLIPVW